MAKEKTPAQDPLVGQAATANAEVAREALGLSRDTYADQKAMTDRFAPLYEQIMNSQVASSATDTERSASQWDQYETIFQPLENQMAEQAKNYANPEEIARREGLAAATVGKQFDAATGQTARELGRMGASPTSSLGLQAITDQGNAKALATAGAVNQERNNTKLLGMSLVQDAAKFGRNQTSTGLAASASALNGGQAATGTMGAQTAQAGAAAQSANGLLNTSMNANNASGSLALDAWKGQSQAASANNAATGQLIGTGIGAASMLMMSSKELKEDGAPVSDEDALAGLTAVPVAEWKYKDGVADSGRHTGPYAEDMRAQFGDGVAPGGVGLDIISVSGTHHAAIRALDKKVSQMGEALAGLAMIPVNQKPRSGAARDGKETRLPPQLAGDMAAQMLGLEAI